MCVGQRVCTSRYVLRQRPKYPGTCRISLRHSQSSRIRREIIKSPSLMNRRVETITRLYQVSGLVYIHTNENQIEIFKRTRFHIIFLFTKARKDR